MLTVVTALAFRAPSSPAAGSSLTHIVARVGYNCLEGHNWPAGAQVNVTVKDSGGGVRFATTVTADPSGEFVVNLEANRVFCDIPVTLAPGMTYTASDGSTTKSLLIESLSFDQLDPGTQTAAGTGPAGRPVQVSVYWDALPFNPANNVYVNDVVPDSRGDWFVDVHAKGGMVDSTSLGGVFLPDNGADGNVDFTEANIFVTAVSLNASVPAQAASAAIARASAAGAGAGGGRVLLSGRLSATDISSGVCTNRKRVKLLKVVGKKTKALASARTTKKGRYRFARRVTKTTSFKVRYRGDQTCQRSESRIRTVRR